MNATTHKRSAQAPSADHQAKSNRLLDQLHRLGEGKPTRYPGVVMLPIGHTIYEVSLIHGYVIDPKGTRCLGLTRPDTCRIEVSDVPPPAKRVAVAWHEITHAIKCELDAGQRQFMDEESICDMIGMAMAAISSEKIAELHHYLMGCNGGEPPALQPDRFAQAEPAMAL
jgi:hypothetical protein